MLVADDEPPMRAYVANKVGWKAIGITRIVQAINGIDAYEKIKEYHPVLVVLDIKMPGMNGVQLLEKLQSEGYNEPMAVIALSGYRDFEAAQYMISNRAVIKYLLKPAQPQELLDAGKESLEAIRLATDDPEELGSSASVADLGNRRAELTAAAKRYVREHYAERVSLTAAAKEIHVAPAYLSRVFSSQDKRGFSGYSAWYRAQQAKKLLETTDETLTAIATKCGFGDARNLMRAFKKAEGLTPGEFRAQKRKSQNPPPVGKRNEFKR